MIYDRFVKDASEELFNSIYSDLYSLAEVSQKAIYEACRAKSNGKKVVGYYVGEAQEKLSAFCAGKLSIGDALDFIKIQKAYAK